MEINKFFIDKDANIRTAMRAIDECAKGIALIVEDGKLCATITDGDIRRYLLNGNSIESPAIDSANQNPRTASSRAAAEEMIKNTSFACVPIVNSKNEILDIIFRGKRDIKNYTKLNMPTVIMAGGKGTRLEPFTKILPKPLVPVGDLPIIEHIMKQYVNYDCNDFHIIVNHKKELIKAYFGEKNDYKINFHNEDTPLGTGGGLSLLKGIVDKTFFLTNCDILIDADYDSILDFHKKHNNAITMVCAYKNVVIPYGVIDVGKDGVIQNMIEKPEYTFLTNTGMYIVEPYVLEDIQDNVPIGFPDIIEKQRDLGRNVAVYPITESCWMDMGQLPELENMRKKLYG